ncbi:MAG: hypothetical protein Q9227_005183 [Pyrenula ochraceoflavens]
MSLARAFTKKTRRPEVAPLPDRAGSVRYTPGTIKRDEISLPTELLSTTNVLALTAPDIKPLNSASSTSSLRSGDSSEFSFGKSFLASSTPDTSVESSPVTPEHANAYFDSGVKRSATVNTSRSSSSSSQPDVPSIPTRAQTHSKKAHQELARKRSISRLTPPPTAISSNTNNNVVRNSADFFNANVDQSHPFGSELAQVSEVAEEFGAAAVLDQEERDMMNKGLRKFDVEDYMNEISDMYSSVFQDRYHMKATAWI